MEVYNLLGKLVTTQTGKVTKQDNGLGGIEYQNELPVVEGIYFLNFTTVKEQIVRKIIVK